MRSAQDSPVCGLRSLPTTRWPSVQPGPGCRGRPAPTSIEVTGLDLLLDTIRFITPGNVLGLPSVALPMGVADGLPTGIQIYADLWREDLCLDVAEVIEAAVSPAKVIDP